MVLVAVVVRKYMHTYKILGNYFKRRAFTLLELIVVIVIVSVLASLAIAQYKKAVERGRATEAYTNLSKLRKLALAFYYQYRRWPVLGGASNDLMVDLPHGMGTGCEGQNTFYFNYVCADDLCEAARCTVEGKPPAVPPANGYSYQMNLTTGEVIPSPTAP